MLLFSESQIYIFIQAIYLTFRSFNNATKVSCITTVNGETEVEEYVLKVYCMTDHGCFYASYSVINDCYIVQPLYCLFAGYSCLISSCMSVGVKQIIIHS